MERTSEMTLPEWAEIPRSLVEGDIRETMLPYGHQSVSEEDIRAVVDVLRSDWLTTGPATGAFEEKIAQFCGVKDAVAVSSGTAGLHAAVHATGICPGDEVIVPAVTFAATANAVVYEGGIPVFADIDPDTLLVDLEDVKRKITPKTKAVIAVDYAGQACDYEGLRSITDRHGLVLVADACHSLGGTYKGRRGGSLADLTVFSFHPVKAITAGEGGAVATDEQKLGARIRQFRNHGISTDHRQREAQGAHVYDMVDLGWNYRLSDIQCALGMSQLQRLSDFVSRRQALAATYQEALLGIDYVNPLVARNDRSHAYHLFTVVLDTVTLGISRDAAFDTLRAAKIGVNVHYRPIYLHSFYRDRFGTTPGLCPAAEAAYEKILSLPIFPDMTDGDLDYVTHSLHRLGGWK